MAKHGRHIIADYRRPRALLVPHYHCTIQHTLESIAEQAARYSGVILLAQDRELSEAFVASQPHPELFHIITAPYDTPWLRDRSPIAVKQGDNIHWVLPQLNTDDRPLDENLFRTITRKAVEKTSLPLPQGNLVAGPGDRAVVMINDQQDEQLWREQLSELGPLLGVRRWILSPGFRNEVTGHADVHMRFLGASLAAIAWNEDDAEDRERAEYLQAQILTSLPRIHIIRLPMRSQEHNYASPLNWLQFGRQLLVPRYPITPAQDILLIRQRLSAEGYHCRFIHSPTLEYAGSLHCLTASVYA